MPSTTKSPGLAAAERRPAPARDGNGSAGSVGLSSREGRESRRNSPPRSLPALHGPPQGSEPPQAWSTTPVLCRDRWPRARCHSVPLRFRHGWVQTELQHHGDSWVVAYFPVFFFFCKGGSEFCCNCILNDSFGLSTGGSSRGPGSNKSTEGSRLECKRHSAAWAAERSPRSPSPPHARATRLPRPPHSHPTVGGSPGSTLLWGSSSLASQKLPPRKGHLEVSSHQRLPQPFATYVFVHALDTCSLSHLTLCKY